MAIMYLARGRAGLEQDKLLAGAPFHSCHAVRLLLDQDLKHCLYWALVSEEEKFPY